MTRITAIDATIGGRIRARRNALGMSQEKLAEALDVTFQQVQKYEHGTNRVSGSRLVAMAGALGCSVAALVGESGEIDPLLGLERLDLTIAREAADLPAAHKQSVLTIIRTIKAAGAAAYGR